ncbi:hypothetical protein ABIA39_007493 [Nocardia sp. GAS34]
MRWLTLLVLVWLIIGAIAAGQRSGVNPKATNCHVPQPSR